MAEEGKNLFVGGFGQDVTDETLYAVFGTFGDIISVQLPPDPNQRNNGSTRKHRGFGFIEFQSTADALDAVDNMNLNELNGRRIRVHLAKQKGGKNLLGSHRAVWEDQAWLKEHAVDPEAAATTGPPGEAHVEQ